MALVDVTDLRVTHKTKSGVIRAVDGVSFSIERGETLGLVGESGCGKSTLARAMLRLVDAGAGKIVVDGAEVLELRASALRSFRRRMQIVFQDPYASLNPRMRVEDIVGEALDIHDLASSRADRAARVGALLARVGLGDDARAKFPHELSGGMRQRVGIARALAVEPVFLVCDEPVSALDASVRAQVVNLLADLRDDLGLTLLFIAHDLAVVRHLSTRVAVMYLGRIVEIGPVDDIFARPRHPYTRLLLASAPSTSPRAPGSPPTHDAPPRAKQDRAPERFGSEPSKGSTGGCRFRSRCPEAEAKCADVDPPLVRIGAVDVACIHQTT